MRTTQHRRRPTAWTAAVTAALVVLSLAVALPVAARTSSPPTTVREASAAVTIDWRPCRDGFECAHVRVPLDHDDPDGEQIGVRVIRLPAAAPGQRIGSLFLNPGGPGGSGVDIARGLAQFLPLELRGRFDIVGFDPRGIMRSTALRCYRSLNDAVADLAFMAFPWSTKQETRWIRSDRALAKACRGHAGPILGHMSTADVARDMDLLREAVGDEQLNFLGYSYGSMLGQTYANLFPERSRALVIDGVLDPEAWAGNSRIGHRRPVGTRLRSAEGARATLQEFFRLCDQAGPRCAFSGDSRLRFYRLSQRLRREPITGGGFRFTYADLIGTALGGLYSSAAFPFLAEFFAEVDAAARPARLRTSLRALRRELGLTAEPQRRYPNFVEGFPGVLCSDGNNPRTYRSYRAWADRAQNQMGPFGRLWNWTGSACAVWPLRAGQDQHLGPWNAPTPNPVLVVGNLADPATPYSGAQAAARLLPNSRLLTYAGWGHTAFFSGNYCVDAAVTRYLVTTEPPEEGTVCRPAGSPFAGVQARAIPAAASAQAIAPTIPAAVRRALDPRR